MSRKVLGLVYTHGYNDWPHHRYLFLIGARSSFYGPPKSPEQLIVPAVNVSVRGGSRIFSRGGGGDFQQNFQNFDDLFFFFLGRPN